MNLEPVTILESALPAIEVTDLTVAYFLFVCRTPKQIESLCNYP